MKLCYTWQRHKIKIYSSAKKVVTFLVLLFSKVEIDPPSSWCRSVSRKDKPAARCTMKQITYVQYFMVNQLPLCHIIILPRLPNCTRLALLCPLHCLLKSHVGGKSIESSWFPFYYKLSIFKVIVNFRKRSSLEQCCYVWLEQTDLIYSNSKDLIQSGRI